MKKLITSVAIATMLIATTTIAEAKELYYARVTVVTEVNTINNTVTFTDNSGFLWEIKGCEDWETGDIAALVMNNNGTNTIIDDIIVSATYNGTIKTFFTE